MSRDKETLAVLLQRHQTPSYVIPPNNILSKLIMVSELPERMEFVVAALDRLPWSQAGWSWLADTVSFFIPRGLGSLHVPQVLGEKDEP